MSKWPEILAEMFCLMNEEQQAYFFDGVSEIDQNLWDGRGIFQWRSGDIESGDEVMKDNFTVFSTIMVFVVPWLWGFYDIVSTIIGAFR